jgi:hypothetical protein
MAPAATAPTGRLKRPRGGQLNTGVDAGSRKRPRMGLKDKHNEIKESLPQSVQTLEPKSTPQSSVRRSLRLQTLKDTKVAPQSKEKSSIARVTAPQSGGKPEPAWTPVQEKRAEQSRTTKRRRSINQRSDLEPPSKRVAQQGAAEDSKEAIDTIERWLDESYQASDHPLDEISQLPLPKSHRKNVSVSSKTSRSDVNTTSSRRSERTSISVHDSTYRDSLNMRNIYVNQFFPSPEQLRSAQRLVQRDRNSPELDEESALEFARKSRELEDEGEEGLAIKLAQHILPQVPDSKIDTNPGQPWSNAVPLPLDPRVKISPLPLPKPKTDVAYGYAKAAFTREQLETMRLLVDEFN